MLQTPPYRAPEVCLGDANYGPRIDCWSLGCILAEFVRGGHQSLFEGASDKEIAQSIFRQFGVPPDGRLHQLPGWSEKYPHLQTPVWPPDWWPAWRGTLGKNFLTILRGLLTVDPQHRVPMDAASRELQALDRFEIVVAMTGAERGQQP